MYDFIRKYQKKNTLSHISLIIISFTLAFSIFITTKDSNISEKLKGNILEATTNGPIMNADFYMTSEGESRQFISIKAQKKPIKKITFSLSYNPEDIDISSIESVIPRGNIELISNQPGIASVFCTFESPISITKEQDIIRISTEKKSENIAFINLFNANLTNQDGIDHPLSTSGIDF